MFLADSIGEEYRNWKAGDCIFISAPTGSGKTTFILKELLPYLYMLQEPKKILYLVNRTALKQQMENEISKLPFEKSQLIKVELYQTIESMITELSYTSCVIPYYQGCIDTINRFVPAQYRGQYLPPREVSEVQEYTNGTYNKLEWVNEYDYVVCDEAHYFLMDSNYNTNTCWSFRLVSDIFGSKVRIYMSATIDDIMAFIRKDNAKKCYFKTPYFGINNKKSNPMNGCVNEISIPFEEGRNYDYVSVNIFSKRKELADIIVKQPGKWLVFVDNKEYGKLLTRDILELIPEEVQPEQPHVAFVTSDYKKDYEMSKEVSGIVYDSKQNARVLIATSVLDNGINLKDEELINIAIMADTEIEFIQMLGRKRKNNQKVNLYLFSSNKNHFERRRRINSRRLQMARKNYSYISKSLEEVLDAGGNIIQMQANELVAIGKQHKYLINGIINKSILTEDVESLFTECNGIFHLNELAFENVENLNQYYNKIIDEFDEYGEDAFLRTQLRWLNKSEDEINEILTSAKQSQVERSRAIVIAELEKIVDVGYTKEENGEFQSTIKDHLTILVDTMKEHADYQKYHEAVYKNKRAITGPLMKFLRENCEIPFVMEVKKGIYTVKKAED